jgi:uncharacterized membrane protein YsdA (DUF1294 family)
MHWQPVIFAYAVMSFVTFCVYGFDKRRAKCGGWRVSERHLHGLEFLGGWPGAILGQFLFRHKLRKVTYMLVFVGIITVHVAGWVWWYRRHAMA